uniref:Reverse transcriptase Ty1/copia-type domain-containing protein n=1 Tax=Nicotiana tabacum TaxID=4097 RepID=A0A1S4DLY1_TOBAC|nr:PREDICTED: uncharacterized protein LOC107831191 [Nicotiana tabacum]
MRSAACVQSESPGPSSNFINPSPFEVVAHGFTKEQYQHLMTLLQHVNISTPFSYHDSIATDNIKFAKFASVYNHLEGPSLSRPLVIRKAANGLYFLHSAGGYSPVYISKIPSHVLINVSSFEKLHGYAPTYDHLRSFGCLCHDVSPKPGRDKFQPRSISAICLGYPYGKKGYKLLNLSSHSIFFSRDVVFHEHIFPYQSSSSSDPSSPPIFVDILSPPSVTPSPSSFSHVSSLVCPLSPSTLTLVLPPTSISSSSSSTSHPSTSSPTVSVPELKRSCRTVQAPAYLGNYVCNSVIPSSLSPYVSSKVPTIELHLGYISRKNDNSLFTKASGVSLIVVAIYVDGILLAGDNLIELNSLKAFLDNQFKINDLGVVHYFLGLEITSHQQGYLMSKHKYTSDLLAEFHCDNFTPVSTLLDSTVKLVADMGDPLSDPTKFRRLVGKHNFLQHTKPGISFFVQHLSQFLQSPHVPYMLVALHVLRYLLNAPTQGILLSTSSDLSLATLSDSDWAVCPIFKRFVTGFYITLGGSPISWKSKKQPTVSLSSAEAEYRSLRMVLAKISWLVRLLGDFYLSIYAHVHLFCDSQATLHIVKIQFSKSAPNTLKLIVTL